MCAVERRAALEHADLHAPPATTRAASAARRRRSPPAHGGARAIPARRRLAQADAAASASRTSSSAFGFTLAAPRSYDVLVLGLMRLAGMRRQHVGPHSRNVFTPSEPVRLQRRSCAVAGRTSLVTRLHAGDGERARAASSKTSRQRPPRLTGPGSPDDRASTKENRHGTRRQEDRLPRRHRRCRAGRAHRAVERGRTGRRHPGLLISTEAGKVQGFNHLDKADTFEATQAVPRMPRWTATPDSSSPAGSPTRMRCGWTRTTPSSSPRTSSRPTSRLQPSVTPPWLLVEADVVPRAAAHLMAEPADRSAQRRRRVGRRGDGPRHGPARC